MSDSLRNKNHAEYCIISDASQLTSFVDSLIFRIDGKYFDLTDFSRTHPGGYEILVWAKRKAWDHTQMFSIHHVNYLRASSIMNKFLIRDKAVIERIQELEAIEVPQRFPKLLPHSTSKHYPVKLRGSGIEAQYNYPVYKNEQPWTPRDLKMADCTFELPEKGSFYWELREEIYKYFKKNNLSYYPTTSYMVFWWFALFFTFYAQYLQSYYKSYILSVITACGQLVLGGYGHQFIHNPVYFRKYAYFCLDWIGLYSYTYMVDHIANHHIYTNTICDHHFEGTDPFVYVNPLMYRAKWRQLFNWIMATVSVACGIFGNYLMNWAWILTGKEPFYWCIFIYPIQYVWMCYLVEDFLLGIKLTAVCTMFCSAWYFTIALMNHNQEENWDMRKLTAAAKSTKENGGWAEMQLVTSSDIGYNYGFIGSMMCLWLNYHTVHHLLPTVDMSHHRDAQRILNRVAAKHGLCYSYKPVWNMYCDMLQTFKLSRALTIMCEKDD